MVIKDNNDKERRWYAVYTRSRYEKKVHSLLARNGAESYLPLVRRWRIWSDRKKQVDMPLIPSYIFVRTSPARPREYFDILNTPGVVRFITFEGKPVPIPDMQIEALRRLNSEGIDMECMEDMPEKGSPVKVIKGPMKGLTGEVINTGKKKMLVLRIDSLDKCITLKIPFAMVEKINLKQ